MTTTVISYSAAGISGCPYPGWGLYYSTTVSGTTPLWVCYAPYYDPATGKVQGMTNYMNPTPQEVKAFLSKVTNDTIVINPNAVSIAIPGAGIATGTGKGMGTGELLLLLGAVALGLVLLGGKK